MFLLLIGGAEEGPRLVPVSMLESGMHSQSVHGVSGPSALFRAPQREAPTQSFAIFHHGSTVPLYSHPSASSLSSSSSSFPSFPATIRTGWHLSWFGVTPERVMAKAASFMDQELNPFPYLANVGLPHKRAVEMVARMMRTGKTFWGDDLRLSDLSFTPRTLQHCGLTEALGDNATAAKTNASTLDCNFFFATLASGISPDTAVFEAAQDRLWLGELLELAARDSTGYSLCYIHGREECDAISKQRSVKIESICGAAFESLLQESCKSNAVSMDGCAQARRGLEEKCVEAATYASYHGGAGQESANSFEHLKVSITAFYEERVAVVVHVDGQPFIFRSGFGDIRTEMAELSAFCGNTSMTIIDCEQLRRHVTTRHPSWSLGSPQAESLIGSLYPLLDQNASARDLYIAPGASSSYGDKAVNGSNQCHSIAFEIKSPEQGEIFVQSNDPLHLKFQIWSDAITSMPFCSSHELCILLDAGEESCFAVPTPSHNASEALEYDVSGLVVGTHLLQTTLIELKNGERKNLRDKEPIVFDVVSIQSEKSQKLPEVSHSAASVFARPLIDENNASKVKVAILAINVEENSQTSIFERIAVHLPKESFDVHIFVPQRSFLDLHTSEANIIRGLVDKQVPVHAVLNYDMEFSKMSSNNSIQANLAPLHIDMLVAKYLRDISYAEELLNEQQKGLPSNRRSEFSLLTRTSLQYLVNVLSDFDVATLCNSRGVPTTEVFAEIVRLARRPYLALELPNLFPDPARLAASVDALISPSEYALRHPSVRSFVRVMTSEYGKKDIIQRVIHPAAFTPKEIFKVSAASRSPHSAKAHDTGTFTVAMIGRLAMERSPGLLIHTLVALEEYLQHEPKKDVLPTISPMIRRPIRVIIVGDGPLRDPLAKQLLPHLLSNSSDLAISIEWLGKLSNTDVFDRVLSLADVLVNARLDGETFGLANVEAILAGVPVVAFARGGNDESVLSLDAEGGARCGTLVKAPFTPQRLANATLDVIRSKSYSTFSKSTSHREKCADRARDLYSVKHFTDRYAEVYREMALLSKRKGEVTRGRITTKAIATQDTKGENVCEISLLVDIDGAAVALPFRNSSSAFGRALAHLAELKNTYGDLMGDGDCGQGDVFCAAILMANRARARILEQCGSVSDTRHETTLDLLQVGANVGASEGDPVYNWLRFRAPDWLRATLVEPMRHSFEQLVGNYVGAAARLSYVNAAVVVGNTSGMQTFYEPRRCDAPYHDDGEDSERCIVGFEASTLVASTKQSFVWRHTEWVDEHPPIAKRAVVGVDWASLIKSQGAISLGMLVVDAEGMDCDLLANFPFDITIPEVILFEQAHCDTEQRQYLHNLLTDILGYIQAPAFVGHLEYDACYFRVAS